MLASHELAGGSVRFDSKVVLVTGAERGIGRAIARAFADGGARVAVGHADSAASRHDAKGLEDDLRRAGQEVVSVRADVRRPEHVEELFRSVEQRFGPVDVLVNNAGIYPRALVAEMDDPTFDETISVNLRGTFLCCRLAVRSMIARRSGRIINIASTAAFAPRSRGAHYAASKAGVLGFSRALALEVAAYGITVNVVAPGIVDTAQSREELDDAAFDQLAKEIPLGRIGRPEDIVGAVLFFASDLASWVTGQTLAVNGGRHMR